MANEEKPEAPKPPPPPPKSSKLIAVLAVLGVLNLGATAFVVFHRLTVPAMAACGEGAAHAPSEDAGTAGPGPVVALDPFLVNLNELESTRYLKTTVEVELGSEKNVESMVRMKAAIRDETLAYLSGLKVEETLGEEHRAKIKSGIIARIDKVVGAGSVRNLYFSDFVVQ